MSFDSIKRIIKVENKLLSLILLGAYCGLIFILSSIPGIDLPESIIGFDKLLHLIAYAVLGFLTYQVFINYKRGRRTYIVLIVSLIFSILYALSDEFHQSFVPGRNPDVFDALADGIGSFIGIMIYCRFL